jgi:integrase
LNRDEARRFIAACAPDFRALATAALLSGCRYGELCRLRVEDFNPKAGTLHVAESKSGNPRHITLTAEAAEFFRRLTAGRAGGDVMLRRADGKPWKALDQTRPMRQACENAQISPVITFHGLRHTFASLAVMDGLPLTIVARCLGHTNTSMVEKHYGHLCADYVANQIRSVMQPIGLNGGEQAP